jgi:hypothetical protein
MGQLFDIVKNGRKRNVDGEVLANGSWERSWWKLNKTSMGARF